MSVILINPGQPKNEQFSQVEKLPPLGLAYLAAMLERNKIPTDIHDNYLLEWDLPSLLNLVKDYDVVGITSLTANSLVAIELADAIKHIYPQKFLLCGGPHPTLFSEQMIEHFDCVVRGEGEKTIVEVVKDRTKGIVTGERTINLDDLPFPARHKLPLTKYPMRNEFLKAKRVFNVNTSRGCPFNCSFCSVKIIWGREYRAFSPSRVAQEIMYLMTEYDATGIYFREDNFTYDRKRVEEICSKIKHFDLEWLCESRVEHLDEPLVKTMYDAGCRGMWFGVESGSERVLKLMHKGINKERAIETFKLCKKYGIKTGASFIVGLPFETKGDLYDTLNFAHRLDGYWTWFNYFLGIPGSDLYTDIIAKNSYEKLDSRKFAWVKVDGMSVSEMISFRRKIVLFYHLKKPIRLLRLLFQLPPGTWFIALIKMFKRTQL